MPTNQIFPKDLITWGLSGLAVLISVFSLFVSLWVFRSNKKHTTRINLYPARKKIYEACFEAIKWTMHSFVNLLPDSLDDFNWSRKILMDLVDAERESQRLLPIMNGDIKKLVEKINWINHLRDFSRAEMYPGASREEIEKHKEEVLKYEEELKVLRNEFFEVYALEGVFMKKFNEAISIEE